MLNKRSNERLDKLRERLYARGESPRPQPRTSLREEPSAPRVDTMGPKPPAASAPEAPEPSPVPPPISSRRKNIRMILIIVAVSFFILSVAVSSLYILLGRNTISGANIALGITGPFTVGGGDTISLQVGITNQNSVAIESATIVVEYPTGTRSADGDDKELYTERIPITAGIAPGETRNVPVKARVFGEENQEASIRVSVEYRMAGSGATFYKEAAPHRFKIGSAPITFKIDAEKTISSGQETTIKLTLISNSPTPVKNLVVRADYPSGFDFTRSEPAPQSARNIWSIPELKPEESATIEITGVVTGTKTEKYVTHFTVGVSDGRNQGSIASVLAVSDTEFTLEDPFLDVEVQVDNRSDGTVSVASGAPATVALNIRNTLDTTVYDGQIEVKLAGNALADRNVHVSNGYYDSNTKTITFDVSTASSLRSLSPGSTVNLSFSVLPEISGIATPQLTLDVSASARRVSQNSARETIAGTVKRVIRVESRPTLSAELIGSDSGPVPPRVGQSTAYTVGWKITNSANKISGAVVTATLPSYVEWAGETGGSGAWSYNPSTRSVEWRAGSVESGGQVSGSFKVRFVPSSTQVGATPTLVESASLRSNDDFTGSVLRHSAGAVTTAQNGQPGSGAVQN